MKLIIIFNICGLLSDSGLPKLLAVLVFVFELLGGFFGDCQQNNIDLIIFLLA